MKAIIFARVSSKEQEESGYSLDSQAKMLQAYATNKQLSVEQMYKISESATGKQIRKTFNEMIRYVTKHKISVIICEKIDRLTRNLKDAAVVSDWIMKPDENRSVHFVKENFVLNKNTRAHENLVWDMKVAIARFYVNNLSEEVRKGQKEKIAQGWLPTKPPLGYKTVGEKGHKIHKIDENKAVFIKQMFELYSTGNYSVSVLVEKMFNIGLRSRTSGKVGRSRMYDLLSDPFYCGKLRWKNKIYQGKQEPIINEELYDIVQNRLNRRMLNPQFQTHFPVFKAKVKCGECGNIIAWYEKKQHWYGDCKHHKTCSQRGCIRQERVEEQLFAHIDSIAPFSPNILQDITENLKDRHKKEIDIENIKRSELQNIIKRSEMRLEKIYEDKIDGQITVDFYEKKLKEYSTEKEQATKEIRKLDKVDKLHRKAGIKMHELASKAIEIFQSAKAQTEHKRLLLSQAFDQIILKNGKIDIVYTVGFEFLLKHPILQNLSFEPPFLSKNRAFCPDLTAWLRG